MELRSVDGDDKWGGGGLIAQGGIFVAEEVDVCREHDGTVGMVGK